MNKFLISGIILFSFICFGESLFMTTNSEVFITSENKILQIVDNTIEENNWIRPGDWLAIPSFSTNEEKIVVLYAVYPPQTGYTDGTNDYGGNHFFVCIQIQDSGTYTVDWGDGTIITNAASSHATPVYHGYDYDSLPNSSYCSRGYKQALITITPNNQKRFYSFQRLFGDNYRNKWLSTGSNGALEIYLSTSADGVFINPLSGLELANQTPKVLEHIHYINKAVYGNNQFSGLISLRSITTENTTISNSATTVGGLFSGCWNIDIIEELASLENQTTIANYFYNCYNIKSVPKLNIPKVTNLNASFNNCARLEEIELENATNVNNIGSAFYGCSSLRLVKGLNTSKVTVFDLAFYYCKSLNVITVDLASATSVHANTFYGCYSLNWVQLNNMNANVTALNFTGANLGREALTNLFTSLYDRTSLSAGTLTITSTKGISYLTPTDETIATSKNWTLVK